MAYYTGRVFPSVADELPVVSPPPNFPYYYDVYPEQSPLLMNNRILRALKAGWTCLNLCWYKDRCAGSVIPCFLQTDPDCGWPPTMTFPDCYVPTKTTHLPPPTEYHYPTPFKEALAKLLATYLPNPYPEMEPIIRKEAIEVIVLVMIFWWLLATILLAGCFWGVKRRKMAREISSLKVEVSVLRAENELLNNWVEEMGEVEVVEVEVERKVEVPDPPEEGIPECLVCGIGFPESQQIPDAKIHWLVLRLVSMIWFLPLCTFRQGTARAGEAEETAEGEMRAPVEEEGEARKGRSLFSVYIGFFCFSFFFLKVFYF